MAIASILHRVSGIILFLLMPFALYFLEMSIISPETFMGAKLILVKAHWKFLMWGFFSALIYHLLAGIRHMVMDLGFGEHLSSARVSALIVISLTVVLSILLGIWIW